MIPIKIKSPLNPVLFVNRVWRRFVSLPFIKKPWIVGKDTFRAVSFWARRREREGQQTAFQNFQTLEELFRFSTATFGSHQIKHEILNFLELARVKQPECVGEIGTADGGTNFMLSQALPSVRLMMGVELYVKNRVQLHYFSKTSQQLIFINGSSYTPSTFINGSSYTPSTVERVRRRLAGINLDLLFINGEHNYEGVKQDFLKYRHLLRDNGLIVFHDIVPDYLTPYGIKTERWVGGVPRFWSKIKLFYPFYEFVEEPDQDGLKIGARRYYSHISLADNL